MGFVLTGATLIDGNGGAALNDAAVYVEGERIAWVGSAADLPPPSVPPSQWGEVEQIDVSGKWLMPGIIDAHIHICYNGSESTFALLEKPARRLGVGSGGYLRAYALPGRDHDS